jgi:preprotein translocase subunit SecF
VNFVKYNWLYALISSLVIIPGLIFILLFGFKLSLDFTGGSLLEFKVQNSKFKVDKQKVEKILSKEKISFSSLQSTSQKTYILRMKETTQKQSEEILAKLNKEYKSVKQIRFETLGPSLGAELLQKALLGGLLGVVGILGYVAYAFKSLKFGASAILALFHDLLVLCGVFAILGKLLGVEIDALFVTALLTTMSSSVHDTIVVFDRVRETKRLHPTLTLEETINSAMSQTMVRSLNNSMTIIFMLLALFLLGGATIKWFIFALLVGTITGTYSSPFVATPILYLWEKMEKKEDKLFIRNS